MASREDLRAKQDEQRREVENLTPMPPMIASKRQAKGFFAGALAGAAIGAILGVIAGAVFFEGTFILIVCTVVLVVAGSIGGGVSGGIALPQEELATEQDEGLPDV